jgi:regulatory protein
MSAKAKPKKRIKPVTPQYLQNVALYYLERYAATGESLRRVLKRRVYKAARAFEKEPGEWLEMVEKLIARYEDSGLLNDKQYATNKLNSLRQAGKSKRGIRVKLMQKGVRAPDIDEVLSGEENREESEWRAIIRLAKRKKIGPFRRTGDYDLKKELTVLARAGFAYDISKKLVHSKKEDLDD